MVKLVSINQNELTPRQMVNIVQNFKTLYNEVVRLSQEVEMLKKKKNFVTKNDDVEIFSLMSQE